MRLHALPLFAPAFALAIAAACAAPASAGAVSPAALERTARTAAAQAKAADAALREAQARRLDLEARIAASAAQRQGAQVAWSADRDALERALAGLSLSARGASAPSDLASAPALAALAGGFGARAAAAKALVDDDQVRASGLAADLAALTQTISALRAESHALKFAADVARREADARPKATAGIPTWRAPVTATAVRIDDHRSGVIFAAKAGAVVRAPVDGRISYAGLFRTYGQVLILDAPGGYAFVLSGMDRIHAATGQVVRRGDRLGALAPQGNPQLGLELRKNGKPLTANRWTKDEIKPRTGVSIADRRETGRFQTGSRRE
ncbi:MAG: murein hydrolase activator EnvC family protein [Caulobacterales bacterium]